MRATWSLTHRGRRSKIRLMSMMTSTGRADRVGWLRGFLVGVLAACVLAVTTVAPAQEVERLAVETLTLPEDQFLPAGTEGGRPATIWGELRIPPGASGPSPVVILAHGCGGVNDEIRAWIPTLNEAGVATMALDSFGGRGIANTCTGTSRISAGSLLVDLFRTVERLATHPRVDGARIAVMGFSMGGRPALWSANLDIQRRFKRGGPELTAHLALYSAGCYFELFGETQATSRPIRLLHGSADDWTPVEACREFVGRLRGVGADIEMIEYAGAHHSFDNPSFGSRGVRHLPNAINVSRCRYVESSPGVLRERSSGRPPGPGNPCQSRGVSVGYDSKAQAQAFADVRRILASVFKLREPAR